MFIHSKSFWNWHLMQRCFFFKGCISNSAPWNAIAKTIDALDFLCLGFHSSGSMTFSHTNACVFCVRSRNPPSSFITDPNGSAVVGQKRLVVLAQWLRTVLRAIYAETINAHTKQTPVNTDTSQQNNKTSTATATLATFGNNRFSLFVRPLYVLDMWKIERKHIFILLYRWEKWNQDRIGTLFTLLKQKKTKKKVMRKGLTFFLYHWTLFPLQLWAKRWCSVSAVLRGSVHFYTANQKRGGVLKLTALSQVLPNTSRERRAFLSLYKSVYMSVLFQSGFFLYFSMSLWVKLWIGKFMCSIYVLFTNCI